MSGTTRYTHNMTLYVGTHSQYANNTVTVVPAHITILAGEWTQLKASFCGHFFFLSFII